MEKEKKGVLARYVKIIVVLAVMAGSSSGIFGSVIEAPSLAIGFWRLTIGVPFFAVPVLLKQRDVLKQISVKDYIWTFVAGAFLFGHFFSWFNAVKMTNVASAASAGRSCNHDFYFQTEGWTQTDYGHCSSPSRRCHDCWTRLSAAYGRQL